jgi:hypothetical protein
MKHEASSRIAKKHVECGREFVGIAPIVICLADRYVFSTDCRLATFIVALRTHVRLAIKHADQLRMPALIIERYLSRPIW